MPTPTKGTLLIAEPYLGDPHFERSVVLLCEHNEQGSFGFVLNQRSNLTLNDVLHEPTATDFPLYIGGPVEQNTLHYIHRVPNIEDAVPITEDLYWSGDFEDITTKLNLGQLSENDIRFFVGYSGWSSGQLMNEIKHHSWMLAKSNAPLIFEFSDEQFWRSVLRKMGGEYKVKSNYPTDPRLN
jgi:putative transcriptional regulator